LTANWWTMQASPIRFVAGSADWAPISWSIREALAVGLHGAVVGPAGAGRVPDPRPEHAVAVAVLRGLIAVGQP
jgi:hypothetical protein